MSRSPGKLILTKKISKTVTLFVENVHSLKQQKHSKEK